MDQLITTLLRALADFSAAMRALLGPAIVFGVLAVLTKRKQAFSAARKAVAEFRINMTLHLLDGVAAGHLVAILLGSISVFVQEHGLALTTEAVWNGIGKTATLLLVLFVGDLIGYWRHRLEHTVWLWPAHAIHHSDTGMSWLTLLRFHPLNRVTTAGIDTALLAIIGFPAWALIASNLARHYYGYVIHADLPWTYGPLGYIFVSPVNHQWHHARDIKGSGGNFASIFSCIDLAFGTGYVPISSKAPVLGVTDEIGPGASGQLWYPFQVLGRALRKRLSSIQLYRRSCRL